MPSQKLFVVALDSFQGEFACLKKEFHKTDQPQLRDQCCLVDQNAHLLTFSPLGCPNYLDPEWCKTSNIRQGKHNQE